MKNLILIPIIGLLMSSEVLLYDFNSPQTAGKWNIVNDGVMGGVSTSDMVLNQDSTATFSGFLRAENNGGFASVRAVIAKNLDNFNGVIIRIKGDGNIYSLRFRTNNNFDGASYEAKIKSEENAWKEFKIPFDKFKATFRGRTLSNQPVLQAKNIRQVGILISDNQFGKFEMHVDWIKFY